MFCSGCGQALVPGQPVCNRCGRPVVMAPPIPGLAMELDSYAGKLRALGVVWIIYGVLMLAFGMLGLAFANAFVFGHIGPWAHGGPWGRDFPFQMFGPVFLKFIWLVVLVRSGLAIAAGWGLLHRTRWGRVVAIVSAFFSILKVPFGTAVAIWTLVVLMGYRNNTLYEQLPEC